MGSNSRSLCYLDKTRGVDNMFAIFEKEKETVLNLLINDPDKLVKILYTDYSPIPTDKECMYRLHMNNKIELGSKDMSLHLLRKSYRCTGCHSLSRICDLTISSNNNNSIDNKRITIECGNYIDKEILVREYDVYHSLILIKNNRKYLISDTYTNNLLINWALSKIVDDNYIFKIYSAFICYNKSYLLTESYSTNNNISNISNIKEILLQIVIFLSKTNLIVGNKVMMQLENLNHKDTYKDKEFTFNTIVKFSNFEDSTLPLSNLILTSKPITNNNKIKSRLIYSLSDDVTTIISNRYEDFNRETVISSFYFLFYKLLINYPVIRDMNLLKLLFTSVDLEKVIYLLNEDIKSTQFDKLKDYDIKFNTDALDITLKFLSS